MKKLLLCFISIILFSQCKPPVDTFTDSTNDYQYYYSKTSKPETNAKDTLKVMTWNIRFGAGRIPWFGDACGNRTVLSYDEINSGLKGIVSVINQLQPDILLLEEVDVDCKRTGYIDQMQYILDHTYFKYGVYTSNWRAQYIPSDGLGRMDEGNAILSRWSLSDAKRTQLPLRNDLDALTRYFYVRECVLSAKVNMTGKKDIYVNVTHLAAFSTDDTKKRQLDNYLQTLADLTGKGQLITGGDYNLLPPNSDSTDYCDEDICPGESYHKAGDNPMHKEGSNYLPEITWLQALYDAYKPSLPLDVYKQNQAKYFTHCTNPKTYWDRTLDYLFSNTDFIKDSHKVWQEFMQISDHAPVTALIFTQNKYLILNRNK